MRIAVNDGTLVPIAHKPDIRALERARDKVLPLTQCETTLKKDACELCALIEKVIEALRPRVPGDGDLPGQETMSFDARDFEAEDTVDLGPEKA